MDYYGPCAYSGQSPALMLLLLLVPIIKIHMSA